MTIKQLIVPGVAVLVLAVIVGALVWLGRRPRKIKHEVYQKKWKQLPEMLHDKKGWPVALKEADALLDKALKRLRFKGKSMGERLVSAQRMFTDNEAVWFGHKLRTKVDADPKYKLTQDEVKRALMGIRQALKDIGVLK